jgi:hypothetical protein
MNEAKGTSGTGCTHDALREKLRVVNNTSRPLHPASRS